MDLEPFKKVFLEDAAPLKERVDRLLPDLKNLNEINLKQLYLDAHTLKGGYLQFDMLQEATWADEIEQKARSEQIARTK